MNSILLPIVLSILLVLYWLIYIYPERWWVLRDLSKMSINTVDKQNDMMYCNEWSEAILVIDWLLIILSNEMCGYPDKGCQADQDRL